MSGVSRTAAPAPFDLLETLRWAPGEGFFLLERHVQRLQRSAEYFQYPCHMDRIRAALAAGVAGADRPSRVRLLVDRHGAPRVEAAPLVSTAAPLRVTLAKGPVDPADPFLFHKTTHREQIEYHRSASHDDVILWNPAREITESILANVVVQMGDRRVTPPVECGLLAGTMRAELLARGEIVEGRVTVDELLRAPQLWLINSVRGWRDAVFDPVPGP